MIKHTTNETTETVLTCSNPEKDHQPNATDLRIGKIFTHAKDAEHSFILSGDEKVHIPTIEVKPIEGKDCYILHRGYYTVEFENRIEVGTHEAGWTIPRSTLVRNGVIIHSALYDSGYVGKMVAGMSVLCDNFIVAKNERIAQYVCVDAESVHLYNGSYQEKSI